MKNNSTASTAELIDRIKHFLPSQAPLKDFIHHNTLHAFQEHSFHEAISQAREIFGYKTYLTIEEYQELYQQSKIKKVTLQRIINRECPSLSLKELMRAKTPNRNSSIGELRKRWKSIYKIDIDSMVHPLLFRVISSYLDQGISIWDFPKTTIGFLDTLRTLEGNGLVSWFKTKLAKKLLLDKSISTDDLLEKLVGPVWANEHYLFDQQFSHPGYSGMVSVIEESPHMLLDSRAISLQELIHFELLLEIDALEYHLSGKWEPLVKEDEDQFILFKPISKDRIDKHFLVWQEAFEWSYYEDVLSVLNRPSNDSAEEHCTTQAIFCIDDRECSIRRHLEELDPSLETFGTAGFFNVEFYFQPIGSDFTTKSCPAPLDPQYIIQEKDVKEIRSKEIYFNRHTHSVFTGWFITQIVGFWSAVSMSAAIFFPKTNKMSVSSNRHMHPNSRLTVEYKGEKSIEGKQIGFTISEMADRVEGLLRSIGLIEKFGSLVYVIGHGSSSANNTHYAGYDCGACSGRPGSVNARVVSEMANREDVRELLKQRGIEIPNSTQFIPVLHDTCKDEFLYFDESILSGDNTRLHSENKLKFNKALDLNALERSRRFLLIDSTETPEKVHQKVKLRSVSLFEPRPELNHATNALCIVGRRELTNHVFLDRRAFLNSYNYATDLEGKYLLGILNAVAPVCGGINLEYYFSRVDNQQLGAGTKLPHNVMGLFGVSNGIDGDLRTGLPSQMIEVHDPVRLLVIVEHFPDIVKKIIQVNDSTYQWFNNGWIHLVVVHPENSKKYRFNNGEWDELELQGDDITSKGTYFKQVLSSHENEKAFKFKSI